MGLRPQDSGHPGAGGGYSVDVRDATAVQVGDGNLQINYAYYQTWTDGLAPPPLVGVSLLRADTGPNNGVNGVVFSPDGKLLASGYDDGTVRLWNPATERPAGFPVTADAYGSVRGVAFSADGKLLATSDDNAGGDTVRMWSVSALADPYAALCAAVGAPARSQWQQYAPGEPFPKACA